MNMSNFTGDNHHNNLWLIAIGFFSNLLEKLLPSNFGTIIQIFSLLATTLAIINYGFIFFERYKKFQKSKKK